MSSNTDMDSVLEQLISERQKVAPEAFNGDSKAKKEWERLSRQITERESELQLAEQARIEQQRRDEEAERQRIEAERQAKENALAELQTEYTEKLRALEKQIYGLVTPIEEVLALGVRAYQASQDLGRSMKWNLKADIVREVCAALGPVLPELGHVDPQHRHLLVPGQESQYKPPIVLARKQSDSLSSQGEAESALAVDNEEDGYGLDLSPDPDPTTPSPTLNDLLPLRKEVAA